MEKHAAGRLSAVQEVHGQQAPTGGAVHLSCPPLQAGKYTHTHTHTHTPSAKSPNTNTLQAAAHGTKRHGLSGHKTWRVQTDRGAGTLPGGREWGNSAVRAKPLGVNGDFCVVMPTPCVPPPMPSNKRDERHLTGLSACPTSPQAYMEHAGRGVAGPHTHDDENRETRTELRKAVGVTPQELYSSPTHLSVC